MVGRKPKPTHLKILEGNPGKRPINTNEPKPRPIAPKCPRGLSAAAKREWERVAPLLERCGLLTEIDMAALAAYCTLYGRWIEAETTVRKEGLIILSPNGYPQQSPHLQIANRCLDQMKTYLVEFGMTPSSRTRISVNSSESSEDPMESLLHKRGRKSAQEI